MAIIPPLGVFNNEINSIMIEAVGDAVREMFSVEISASVVEVLRDEIREAVILAQREKSPLAEVLATRLFNDKIDEATQAAILRVAGWMPPKQT